MDKNLAMLRACCTISTTPAVLRLPAAETVICFRHYFLYTLIQMSKGLILILLNISLRRPYIIPGIVFWQR